MKITYDPKPLTADQLPVLSQDVKQALTERYGDRLDRMILYGSYARGDFHGESDVDCLVVLRHENFRLLQEIDKCWGFIWDSWQRYGAWISLRPTFLCKYN